LDLICDDSVSNDCGINAGYGLLTSLNKYDPEINCINIRERNISTDLFLLKEAVRYRESSEVIVEKSFMDIFEDITKMKPVVYEGKYCTPEVTRLSKNNNGVIENIVDFLEELTKIINVSMIEYYNDIRKNYKKVMTIDVYDDGRPYVVQMK